MRSRIGLLVLALLAACAPETVDYKPCQCEAIIIPGGDTISPVVLRNQETGTIVYRGNDLPTQDQRASHPEDKARHPTAVESEESGATPLAIGKTDRKLDPKDLAQPTRLPILPRMSKMGSRNGTSHPLYHYYPPNPATNNKPADVHVRRAL